MRQQMRAFDTYTHINELKKAGFNEEQAAVIIKSLVDSRETDTSHLATKEQISEVKTHLTERIAQLEISTKEQIANSEASTKEQITKFETSIKEQMAQLQISIYKHIADTHASTLKWMVGTMIAFAGILLAGIKLL